MSTEHALKKDLLRYCQAVYDKGWVANHDGNLTARVAQDRYLATPTAFSKADITADSLIAVNNKGERISGRNRPFSEMVLHLAVYAARPDAQAVIHAHPPYATAMACAGKALDTPFMPEAVVSLGAIIPLAPYAAPKTPGFTANIEPLLPYYDVIMLKNHGVLAFGDSFEQAFLRMELVEHLAKIAAAAMPFGGVQAIPGADIERLLAARAKAGLGPVARGLQEPYAQYATRPAPERSMGAAKLNDDKLIQAITQELKLLIK